MRLVFLPRGQLLSQIRSLPAGEQVELATTVLDELAMSGQLPLSEPMKAEWERRLEEHRAGVQSGQTWGEVRAELFRDE